MSCFKFNIIKKLSKINQQPHIAISTVRVTIGKIAGSITI